MTVGAEQRASRRWSGVSTLAAAWWRVDRVTLGLAAVVVAATVALSTGLAGWTDDAGGRSFRAGLSAAVEARLAVVVRSSSLAAVDPARPFESVTGGVEARAAELPSVLSGSLGPAEVVVDTGRFEAVEVGNVDPASPTFVTMRTQTGYLDRSTLVTGRRAEALPPDPILRVIEVELSVATADVLGVAVGDSILVEVSLDDPLARRYERLPEPFRLRVVGIVELDDIDDPRWFGDDRLHEPIINDTPVGSNRLAMAAVAPGSLRTGPYVIDGRAPFAVERRAKVGIERVDPSDGSELRAAVRSLDASTERTAGEGEVAVVTSLGPLLDDIEAERRALHDLGLIARVAVLVVGAGALGVVTAARARRGVMLLDHAGRLGVRRSVAIVGSLVPLAAVGVVAGAVGVVVASLLGWAAVGVGAGVVVLVVAVGLVSSGAAVARAVSGVERVDADGVELLRVGGGPHGWPRLRVVVELLAVSVVAGVTATVASREPAPVDLLLVLVWWLPPIVVVAVLFRWSVTSVGRRAGVVGAVAVVAVGWSWTLVDAVDPSVEAVARTASMSVVVAVLSAAGVVGMVVASAPGPDLAAGGRRLDERVRRPWSDAITPFGGVVIGGAWLAILLSVLADRVDLVRDTDTTSVGVAVTAMVGVSMSGALGAALVAAARRGVSRESS